MIELQSTRSSVYAGLDGGGVVAYSKVCGDGLEAVGEVLDVAGGGSEPGVAVDGRGRFMLSWTESTGVVHIWM